MRGKSQVGSLPWAAPTSSRSTSRNQDTGSISGENLGTLPPALSVRLQPMMMMVVVMMMAMIATRNQAALWAKSRVCDKGLSNTRSAVPRWPCVPVSPLTAPAAARAVLLQRIKIQLLRWVVLCKRDSFIEPDEAASPSCQERTLH